MPARRVIAHRGQLQASSARQSTMLCTDPLPNVGAPTTVARWLSCNAPATSSAALALYSLTRMVMGSGERAARAGCHLFDDLAAVSRRINSAPAEKLVSYFGCFVDELGLGGGLGAGQRDGAAGRRRSRDGAVACHRGECVYARHGRGRAARGALDLGGAAADGAQARALAEHWFAVLETLVRHAAAPDAGGRSPSDLPLLTLSQAEIERLERMYRTLKTCCRCRRCRRVCCSTRCTMGAAVTFIRFSLSLALRGRLMAPR